MRKIKPIRIFLIIISILMINIPVQAKEELAVEYLGDTKEIFITSDDFFVNIGGVLPGDIIEDYATLINTSNKEIKMYFKTEPFNQDEYLLEEDYQLLEEIQLGIDVIREDGTIENVYYGSLGAKDFIEFKEIGLFEPNEKASFTFKLEVPSYLTNKFDMTQTKVKWIFGVGEIDSLTPSTGDNVNIMPLVMMQLTSVSVFMALLVYKKKNRKIIEL